MRWILSLFTIYLVLLSSLPCSDAKNQCADGSKETVSLQSHNHYKDSDDSCGPFCYCSCCSVNFGSYDFKPTDVAFPKNEFVNQKVTIHQFTFVSKYLNNIWNPPKATA